MSSEANGFTTIIGFVFFVGILMTLFRLFVNPSAPQFSLEYFLNVLSNVPAIDITWISKITPNDLDVPKVIKTILNCFTLPLGFTLWVCMGMLQLLLFVIFFVSALFGLI